MQDSLFDDLPPAPTPPARAAAGPAHAGATVPGAAPVPGQLVEMAAALPPLLRMGGSTWSYPGWEGLVWDGPYDPSVLAKNGLTAYAQHPLLRTVCIDRSFWRPLTVSQYAGYAGQSPADFSFVVKCPSVVTDALVRAEDGRGRETNPAFLDAELAVASFVEPALEGLGGKLGVLVFQLSPLTWDWLTRPTDLFARLQALLERVRLQLAQHPQVIVAVEVRDPELLVPAFAQVLRAAGATFCLGLHGKMPPIEEQLPLLRSLWPGPLVCRWNLNRRFGPYGYEDAQKAHAPFNQIVSPDPHTRALLARTIAGVTGAGQRAYVTVSNDAEGCAPRSIALLAEAVLEGGAGVRG
ncbi:DUF72 domain-containing protein [Comamonas endophytica]|uniref:DUF72 domain-containing protein n=2 Tax=Comamonas endophytica TaxID=2949090 RepID=A0ABY6G8R3_9BURK|nr:MULTISPECIES: DUF72 domain-containing protein [unclassified Acidovorax]MCD2511725.1 DUF72 domain-containing protein [Acidovorax sp. D4N7]UYG51451.1 DUF72 domain-containing protein [Acidovorax sp. 5MLIR]